MEKLVICKNQVHTIQRHNKYKYCELRALWILSVQRKVSPELLIQGICAKKSGGSLDALRLGGPQISQINPFRTTAFTKCIHPEGEN